MVKLVSLKDFDSSKVIFSEPKKNRNVSSYTMYASYKDGKTTDRCLIKVPRVWCPFGASQYQGSGRFTMNLSLDKENATMIAFKEQVMATEKQLIQQLLKLDPKLLTTLKLTKRGKTATEDSLEDKMSTPLKGLDSDYSPTLAVKVPGIYGKNTFRTRFFNTQRQPIEVTVENIESILPKSVNVRAVISLASAYIMPSSGGFGLTFRMEQVVVEEKPTMTECLLDMVDDDEDVEEEKTTKTEVVAFEDDDSDDETA